MNGGGSGMVGSVSCFWKDLERVVLHRGRLDLRQWELEANITCGLPLSEKGALSAIPTEGNYAERPKVALSPTLAERKCAERPEGPLSKSCRL